MTLFHDFPIPGGDNENVKRLKDSVDNIQPSLDIDKGKIVSSKVPPCIIAHHSKKYHARHFLKSYSYAR